MAGNIVSATSACFTALVDGAVHVRPSGPEQQHKVPSQRAWALAHRKEDTTDGGYGFPLKIIFRQKVLVEALAGLLP